MKRNTIGIIGAVIIIVLITLIRLSKRKRTPYRQVYVGSPAFEVAMSKGTLFAEGGV